MHHGWTTCERSLFFKKVNLATVWFLGNFNLFSECSIDRRCSIVELMNGNITFLGFHELYLSGASLGIQISNYATFQWFKNPRKMNCYFLACERSKKSTNCMYIFLKKAFIRGISRKTLYCLCKIKNKADSPFSFLIWVTSNWMLPVWFLRLSLSLYSKGKLPSKSELKSFFCFNFSPKKNHIFT